jgi:hypothetical protein
MKSLIYLLVVSLVVVTLILFVIPKKYFCTSTIDNKNVHNMGIFNAISTLKTDASTDGSTSSIKNKTTEKPTITPLKTNKKMSDYEKAKQYILDKNSNNIRYMNGELLRNTNIDRDERVLIFTFCIPGQGAEVKHGNPGILCDFWWECMEAWFNNIKEEEYARDLQIAMVRSKKNYNFIDERRSPHWLKLILLYTFLETEFESTNSGSKYSYSTVIFIDSDSVVRIPKWNVGKFINETMFSHVQLMLSEDANDFISTGEIFAKKGMAPFILDWYNNAIKFYGRLFLPHETYLGRLKVNNGMTNTVEEFATYKKIKYFWSNAKKFVDHGDYKEPLNL